MSRTSGSQGSINAATPGHSARRESAGPFKADAKQRAFKEWECQSLANTHLR